MPIDLMVPSALKKPVTPTTALSLRSASVVAGSSRFTCPALSCSWSAAGIASRSTLRPTLNAVLGLTPGPMPPLRSPAIALWSCSASPQNVSSPNVSNRKVCRPSAIMRSAFSSMTRSNAVAGRATACQAATVRTPSPRQATTAKENRIRSLPSDNQQALHGGVQRAGVRQSTASTRDVTAGIALLQLTAVPLAMAAPRGRVRHDVVVDPDDRVPHAHVQRRRMKCHSMDFDDVCARWPVPSSPRSEHCEGQNDGETADRSEEHTSEL